MERFPHLTSKLPPNLSPLLASSTFKTSGLPAPLLSQKEEQWFSALKCTITQHTRALRQGSGSPSALPLALVTINGNAWCADLFSFPTPVHCGRVSLRPPSSDISSASLEPGLPYPPSTWPSHLYPRIQFFLLSRGQLGLAAAASTSSRLLCDRAPRDFILYHLWPQFPLRSLSASWSLFEISHAGWKRAEPYAQERADMLGPGPQLEASWALDVKEKGFSSQRQGEKGVQDQPRARLEAQIQSVGKVPITKALSVRKFFTPHHRESTERPQQQQLQVKEQRGPGSWAEAYEEEHHSGGWRQAPPGCGGRWREG